MFKSFSLQLAVYIVTTMASIETSFAAGSSTCNDPKSPPELTVTISQERIELGQIWELYGKISNSSNCDIYIVNSWAPMGISPSIRPNDEILVRSQGANFLEPGQGSRSLRIPARNSAHLLWRIGDSNSYVMNRERRAKLRELQKISDSCTKLTTSINFTENEEDTECSKKRAFVRASQIRSLAAKEPTLGELISDALHEFSKQAFFVSPGAYEAQFVVHYWYTAPFVKYEPEPESNKSLSGECSELAQKFFAAQTDSKAEELLGKQLAACVATSGDSFDVLGLVEPPNGSGTILPSDGIVLGHKSVNINHSPLVTIVGGGIGGLLGYIFIGLSTIGKSRTQTRDNSQKLSIRELMDTKGNLWKYFGGPILSILIGMIVTILLARLGETRFLLSLKVNDLWGAIVIGIAAELVGVRLIYSLLNTSQPESNDSETRQYGNNGYNVSFDYSRKSITNQDG